MFFVHHMGMGNISISVSWSIFWKCFLGFWLLVVSQVTRADGIADAEAFYGNCLIVKKGTFLECRQIYLEYLDTFADELWGGNFQKDTKYLEIKQL